MPSTYYDYYAVMESAVPSDIRRQEFKIIGEGKSQVGKSLNFLRFQACLMSVGQRNRNRRLWQKQHLDVMMQAPHILDYFANGGLPGESNHPIPMTGKLTPERLVTIDTNNMAILVKDWWWVGNRLMGVVETLDQGEGTPGNRMMMNMLQGVVPAFSARTMVPQRRNPDGSIDVIAPGRMVCFDRVNGPSCPDAYLDVSVPVKNIVTKSKFDNAMENFTAFVAEHSDATKYALDSLIPAMEAATITEAGLLTVPVQANENDISAVIVPVERNLRKSISDFMTSF